MAIKDTWQGEMNVAVRKPKNRMLTRAQIQRRVDLIRFLIKIGARKMVDMEHTAGRLASYETDRGTVRALTYGFGIPVSM